eukprot:2381518-Pyramimonas_sp.AAC.1
MGPETGPATTTEYYSKRVKGCGTGRRPNDVLVKIDDHVARLKIDLAEPKRIDRRGLWTDYLSVKGASSRALRQ